MRRTVPTGTAVTSTAFGVGGHEWRIECYPNGRDDAHRGYTSLFLSSPSCDPTARFGLTVLGAAGKPTSCARASRGDVHFRYLGQEAGWKDFVWNEELHEGEHLVDDCLTVLCDVTVDQGMHADEVALADEVAPLRFDTRGLFAEAIRSKNLSNVVVHAGGESFTARRWVLEALSPVFKVELQDATSGELHIDDVDAEVFQAMRQFMYREALRSDCYEHVEVEATMAERLLEAADRYGLEKLKHASGETLCASVDSGSVGAMLALAERHACPVLKEACMEFLSCAGTLRSFVATDGFQRLKRECPSAAAEIVEIAVMQMP
jgi:speckle-type POZ protein